MSRTFTKLFSSITESTVWCEPDRTRLVWITMLAMADRNGRVWAAVPGLANRARVPVADARTAIETFLSPDSDSRTPDNDGRRIEVIDGGWRLLNHEKYRSIRDEETAKASKRSYINAKREAQRVEKVERSRSRSNTVEHGRDNAEAEAEAEAKRIEKVAGATPACPHAQIVEAYHDILPELPRVKLLDVKGRREQLAKFWAWIFNTPKEDGAKRATTAQEALVWIRTYFERSRSNGFLMGRTARGEGHSSWRCDLDYLVSDKGLIQVIEKTEA